jgi:hypothetical protein
MDFQGSLPGIPVDEHKNTSDGLSPAACHFNQNMIILILKTDGLVFQQPILQGYSYQARRIACAQFE